MFPLLSRVNNIGFENGTHGAFGYQASVIERFHFVRFWAASDGAPPPPPDGERWTCRRFPHPGYAHCRAAAAPVLVGADFQAALPPDAGSPSRERGEARVAVDAATINERSEAEFGSFDRGVLRMVDPDAVADNYPPRKWARR